MVVSFTCTIPDSRRSDKSSAADAKKRHLALSDERCAPSRARTESCRYRRLDFFGSSLLNAREYLAGRRVDVVRNLVSETCVKRRGAQAD